MSLGADALLLVALCSMTSWLWHKRRQRAKGNKQPALPTPQDEALQMLRPNAVICQAARPGRPAQDWLIERVQQPSRGAPIARWCRLDGGSEAQQALLLVLADPSSAAALRGWLLEHLPPEQRPIAAGIEPAREVVHVGRTYTQHVDWRGLVRTQPSRSHDDHQDCRVVLYQSSGPHRLAWLKQVDSDAWYAGHEHTLAELDILPASD